MPPLLSTSGVGVVGAWFEESATAIEFRRQGQEHRPVSRARPERVLGEEERREDELRALDIPEAGER